MTDALENAKGQWNTACHYDKMGMGDSTLLGVESSGNLLVHNPDSGVSTMNVVGGVFVTKTLMGPSYKVVDSVSFMKVVNKNSINGIDTVDVNIFEGHEEAEISPMYAGAGIGFNLAGGQASIFDFNLGVGLSTGIGLKDESVELKAAGTGVTVGRKISISVLDVSFGIDIVRTAQAAWFVGRELFAAVAIVPGALKNGGKDLVNEVASTPNAFYKAGGDLWHEAKKIQKPTNSLSVFCDLLWSKNGFVNYVYKCMFLIINRAFCMLPLDT